MSTAVRLDYTVSFNPEGVLQYYSGWFVDGSYRYSYHIYHLGQHQKPVSVAKQSPSNYVTQRIFPEIFRRLSKALPERFPKLSEHLSSRMYVP